MRTRCFAMLALLWPMLGWAADASYGLHGMALFGDKDGLYASHLPMFHAPHDTQVVLRVHFANAELDVAVRLEVQAGTGLWTLEPEQFELSRLGPDAAMPLRQFTAHAYQGHFEQDGKLRYPDAALIVDEVLLFSPLQHQLQVRQQARYIPVGSFLIKLIDSRPDFDHIVRLRQPVAQAVQLEKNGVEANTAALARLVPIIGTVYYCSADLR
ncbi:hypothetical protein ACFFKC_04790 [Pseudoduganella danionis]|uniref:Uncharacterized protein n=1 Tax=Pseudoduganella danionis TaxID=1890295 RepID=A0ABW9SWR8_9BURK|nr:hypothetical protein [Pseudoduganella danionis]MTW35109.1 hypothetical protein [Pseudoduganella danionis]